MKTRFRPENEKPGNERLNSRFTLKSPLTYGSFITVGMIYLSAKAASTELKNYFTFDLVIVLIVYILVAFSHQWSFINKMDKLCALQDDFSHLNQSYTSQVLQTFDRSCSSQPFGPIKMGWFLAD